MIKEYIVPEIVLEGYGFVSENVAFSRHAWLKKFINLREYFVNQKNGETAFELSYENEGKYMSRFTKEKKEAYDFYHRVKRMFIDKFPSSTEKTL